MSKYLRRRFLINRMPGSGASCKAEYLRVIPGWALRTSLDQHPVIRVGVVAESEANGWGAGACQLLSSPLAPVGECSAQVENGVGGDGGFGAFGSVGDGSFGSATTKPSGEGGGVDGLEAGGEQGTTDAREDVALAAAGHAGVASGIEADVFAGGGNESAGSFEKQGAGVAVDEARSGFGAGEIDKVRGKSGEFAGVRGDDILRA